VNHRLDGYTHIVAFDLASVSYMPAAFPSQSVIGEINSVTIRDALGKPPLQQTNAKIFV
jgi:hypothetical protein